MVGNKGNGGPPHGDVTPSRVAASVRITLLRPLAAAGGLVVGHHGGAAFVLIGHAAFHAAVEQYPRTRLTWRQGARVILQYPE